jgi:hypothetical protein
MGRNKRRSKTNLNIGMPTGGGIAGSGKGGGGYGTVQKGAKVASGSPIVNPFVQPKYSGQNVGSWVYPSQYQRPWDVTSWREACDQAIKMGYTQAYATLTSWVYEKSPFVQSLFFKLGLALDKVKFYINDKDGNEIPELTLELCSKPWQMMLRKEILFSYFWGFSGLNFDPVTGKCYKYPMQQIDPINRMLKANTFSFYDGELFDGNDNLLFIQPSTNYEAFLGWMQPISCSFIEMNVNSNNWVAAGRRLAFPLLTVGYPQDDGSLDQNGQPQNNFKQDAIALATDIDPTNGLVYPYTIDNDGNIIKSIEIDFEQTGTSNGAHKIYQEFNNDQKAEIQELVYGRSVTQSSGKGGNRALGEVEEDALDDRVAGLVPFVLAILNDEFRDKIGKFYKNLPTGWNFAYTTPKRLTYVDWQSISAVTNQNGFKLTDRFFVENGLPLDFFEKTAMPANVPIKQEPNFQMAEKKKSFF